MRWVLCLLIMMLSFEWEAVSVSAAPEKHAVVVGIGNYPGKEISKLKYSRLDAMSVYDFLIHPKGGGYARENVKLLLDEEATRTNIMSALGDLSKAHEDDFVFIFYAGHGATEIDKTSQSEDGRRKFLVPFDANPDALLASAISMGQLSIVLDGIRSKHLVYVADACYSGASSGGRGFRRDTGTRDLPLSDEFLGKISEGKNRVIMTASEANELAMESDEFSNGIFTHYFLEGLKGAADADGDEHVTDLEVYHYLREKVSAKASQYDGNQHPVRKGLMTSPVTLARTGKKTKDFWDKRGPTIKDDFYKREILSWFETFETAMETGDLKTLNDLGYLRADRPQSEKRLKEHFEHVSHYEETIKIVSIEIKESHARVRYDHSQKWIDENGMFRKTPSRSSEKKFKRTQGKWKPVR